MAQRLAEESRYRKFWEAFWEELVEQEFGYVEMDCDRLVTEKAVALGLIEAVPYAPAKHGNIDAEPGDIIYVCARRDEG